MPPPAPTSSQQHHVRKNPASAVASSSASSASVQQARKKPLAVMLPPGKRAPGTNSSSTNSVAMSPASQTTTPLESPAAAPSARLIQRPSASSSSISPKPYDPSSSEEFLRAIHSVDVEGGSRRTKGISSSTIHASSRDEELFPDDLLVLGSEHVPSEFTNHSQDSSGNDMSSTKPASSIQTIVSWIALLIAVFSMAAVGPMFLWLEKQDVSPILAIVWRQCSQTIFLIPPTIIEHCTLKPNEKGKYWWQERVESSTAEEDRQRARAKLARKRREAAVLKNPSGSMQQITTRIDVGERDFADPDATSIDASSGHVSAPKANTGHPIIEMFYISTYWSVSVALWVVALPFTSAARASLFSSLYPLFIIAWLRFFRKVPVSLGEFLGVIVCLVGIACSEVLSSFNPDTNTLAAQAISNSTDTQTAAHHSLFPVESFSLSTLQLLGDTLCLVGSIFIAFNVVSAAPTRKVVPLFAFSLTTSIFVLIQLLLSTVLLEGSSFTQDPHTGVFGWMSSQEMIVRILLFGFVVGMVGILGFNYSVSYINPIIFSTVQLLDPGISGVMSAVFGVEGWPVMSTYIGVGVVTLGIFIVVWYQTKRENATKSGSGSYELVELQEMNG